MTVAELLREAREDRGLSLEQLANQTRIPIDRLAAFERDGLPRDGGFYERAQIRTYGHALGLDQRRVLEALNHDLAAVAVSFRGRNVRKQPDRLPPPERRARQLRVTWSTVMIGGVVVTAFVAGTQMRASRAARPPVTASSQLDSATADVATNGLPEPHAATPVEQAVTALEVTSQPAGARVTVDGIGWGQTPVAIRYLSPGLKRIRVTRDGHAAAERVVRVDEDRSNRVFIRLRTATSPRRAIR